MEPFTIDRQRLGLEESGIAVRAELDGRWGPYDVVHLDRDSLQRRLDGAGPGTFSDEQRIKRAQRTLMVVLGHGLEET